MPVLARFSRLSSLGLLLAGILGNAPAQIAPVEIPPMDTPVLDDTIRLDAFLVGESDEDEEDYDPTGLGYAEAERSEAPFAPAELLYDVGSEDLPVGELDLELSLSSGASPVDLATGNTRINLRGFPTPLRRNGFTQSGFPEVINARRSETILGPLTPITGQAAPGGIRNYLTDRPRGQVRKRLDLQADTNDEWYIFAENAGVVKRRRAWQLMSLDMRNRRGPQDHAHQRTTRFSGSLAVRHSRRTSSLWQLDAFDYRGNPAPGIPEYRPTAGARIVGPYRPLADFHVFGPNAGVRRQAFSVSGQVESQLKRSLSLRAAVQWFYRKIEQDRFTTGQYLLDTGKFSGVREPTHAETPFKGAMFQTDLTWRFVALGADHKLFAGLESTHGRTDRLQRGLTTADRNAQPASVRIFDPLEPDYYRVPYSPEAYQRIITDREEEITYTSLVANTRTALARGRTVFTTGLRQDFVDISVRDDRPGAPQPEAGDLTRRLSYHAGVNRIIARGRALLFGNLSSAFEPSTRVDARTGQIQGNETTFGYETGVRTVLFNRRFSLSAMGFVYENRNIARRNPLYDDPIADADQTQPQLVSGGEERFTGGVVQAGWRPNRAWSITTRAGHTRAVTTASPDLPEEVGRPLTRLPAFSATLGTRYFFQDGTLKGLSLGTHLTHLGEVVAHYENDIREYLEYPPYTLVGVNAGYRWSIGKVHQSAWVNVRNVLNDDLLEKLARPGPSRALNVSYSIVF